MKVVYRPLFVLHDNAVFREHLRTVIPGEYTFSEVADWPSLRAALRASPPSGVAIVDPYASADLRPGPVADLRAVAAAFPSFPILAALEITPERGGDVRLLAAWGVLDVISISHDDTQKALRHRLRRAQSRYLRALLEGLLPAHVPARARTIVDAAVEVVTVGGDAGDLADVFGVSRRTLNRWFERALLPPPRRLLAWCRVLLAAALLDDPGRSVGEVARACGYSKDLGLQLLMHRLTGANPHDLRKRGALAISSAAFLRQLRRFDRPGNIEP